MAPQAMSITEHAYVARTKRRAFLFPMQLMQDWLWSIHEMIFSNRSLLARLNLLLTSVVFWMGIHYGMQGAAGFLLAIAFGLLLGSLPPIDPVLYMGAVIVVIYVITHILLRFIKVLPPNSETSLKRFLFLGPAALSCGVVLQCLVFMGNQITGIDERTAYIILLLCWTAAGAWPIRHFLKKVSV